MLSQQLIENALALTGKTMGDILETKTVDHWNYWHEPFDIICIEKFFYSLLDRQFLIKYYQNQKPWYLPSTETTDLMSGEFWYAIMEYQSDNEKPLQDLLTKIN